MSTMRIFIAIDISASARRGCSAHIEHLRKMYPNVRLGWERPEKLHITLKFLGDVDASILGTLDEEIRSIAGKFLAFSLSLSETGVFPSKSRPRILWIGVEGRDRSIFEVHRSIDRACGKLGFEKEKRRFHPHLTIARVREPHRALEVAAEHLSTHVERVGFTVDDIVVYESKLQPSGSVYTPLLKARLGAD